jgi:hypothetical protein
MEEKPVHCIVCGTELLFPGTGRWITCRRCRSWLRLRWIAEENGFFRVEVVRRPAPMMPAAGREGPDAR